MRHVVVVHYHEIGLKGRNRSSFERALVRQIERVAPAVTRVSIVMGRIVVRTPDRPSEELLDVLARTFGVAYIAPAVAVRADMDQVTQAALALLDEVTFETFAIAAKRASKDFPLTSTQINVELGAAVQRSTGAGVNLDLPDVTVWVEIVGNTAYVFRERRAGAGGLPTGVSGTVVSLLSGGIDSPVATYRVCRRGSRAVLCHFHSEPFTDRSSVRKARELASIVASWQGATKLVLVPFGNTQQEIVVATPPPLRVVLYRRFMFRIAAEIAGSVHAGALVTGESLGQVASQTLDNMRCIDEVATIPVLRPLVGSDKQEIISEARRIGTYETSIQPGADCCSLFVPRSPETHARADDCVEAERSLDVVHLVERCAKEAETELVT